MNKKQFRRYKQQQTKQQKKNNNIALVTKLLEQYIGKMLGIPSNFPVTKVPFHCSKFK